ncbi:MAG: ATP-binding protein [Chloroflexota bacterium]
MEPNKSLLLIINGAPGSGKTHLSRRLSKELQLPLLSKDDIKEGISDVLGVKDRAWSKKLGGASFDALFVLLERQLEAGISCIVETAFIPRFNTPRFLELKERYGCHPFEIYCYAQSSTLAERFNQRVTTGTRHPVHTDGLVTLQAMQAVLDSGKYGILGIGSTVVEVDTTNFEKVDFTGLVEIIKSSQR